MTQQPRFSVRRAIAAHLLEDEAEIEDERRYQPTRTPCPVYSNGNDYLTATRTARKPREDGRRWRWREIEARGYAAAVGWHIWIAEGEDDDDTPEN